MFPSLVKLEFIGDASKPQKLFPKRLHFENSSLPPGSAKIEIFTPDFFVGGAFPLPLYQFFSVAFSFAKQPGKSM